MEPTPLPVSLSERVEFGSPEWLAAAQAYLAPRVEANRGALRGMRFGICEVYTDPPSHLGTGQIAFHFRIDDGELTVDSSEIDNVDFKVRADYNKAHAVVTSVYEQLPDRRTRVLRELNQRAGRHVFELKGDMTTAPEVVQDVIAGLHDHMARRTIGNPDIAHRIEHLGLADRVAELDRNGYTILEGAFSDRWADELAHELRRLIAEGPRPNLAAALLVARGAMFEEAAVHPWVLTLAEYLVGRGCILSQLLAFSKTAGVDTHQLHTDYPLVTEPYPDYCWSATCIWALEDFTETSGPTVVVPGSFRNDHHPARDADVATKKILMPKGSIAMWHGATWHAAAIREDPGDRLTLHNTYTRLFARTFDNYRDIDGAVLERNAPALSTLCGLDDPFEKNTLAGPAREPLNYARANYSVSGY